MNELCVWWLIFVLYIELRERTLYRFCWLRVWSNGKYTNVLMGMTLSRPFTCVYFFAIFPLPLSLFSAADVRTFDGTEVNLCHDFIQFFHIYYQSQHNISPRLANELSDIQFQWRRTLRSFITIYRFYENCIFSRHKVANARNQVYFSRVFVYVFALRLGKWSYFLFFLALGR